MSNSELANVSRLEILGNIFNDDGACTDHVGHPANKCRHSFYSLSPVGIVYSGGSVYVQSYLYKHICQPSLTYGLECISIPNKDLQSVNTVQGKLIKPSLGLRKHSHNTQLLEVMSIKSVTDIIAMNTVGQYHRIFKVASPTRTTNLFDVFISFKWVSCTGLFTGEYCEVSIFYNRTYDFPSPVGNVSLARMGMYRLFKSITFI